MADVIAGHPEDIHSWFLVVLLRRPGFIEDVNHPYPGNLEDLVLPRLQVIGVRINELGRESEGLDKTILPAPLRDYFLRASPLRS
ncbi:MAG: hypothetical protein J6Y90_01305 [Lachnospiraceae bacterium]|nr:hypothetical protein [Lachnospiraceae bacterium]